MSRTRHPVPGHTGSARHTGRLTRMVRHLEHDVFVGLDHAADFLLAPWTVDFRGWTLGDQRNETWM